MRKIYSLLILILSIMVSNISFGQLSGDCVFLKSRFLEIGLSPNGSLGTTTAVPPGYTTGVGVAIYPDPVSCATYSTGVGAVYDWGHDGFTVGTPPFFGDYTLQGSPWEGWAIDFGGVQNSAWYTSLACGIYFTSTGTPTMTGTTGSYTSLPGICGQPATVNGTWTGTVSGLNLTQIASIDTNGSSVVFTIILKNTTSSPITDIYYMRTVDPDNEESITSDFSTNNTVVYNQGLTSSGDYALVSATGPSYPNCYMALDAKDCRARVFIAESWPVYSGATASQYWNETAGTGVTYTPGGTDNGDFAIGIVFQVASLGAGDSTVLSYAYSFDGPPGSPSLGSPIDSALPNPFMMVNCTGPYYSYPAAIDTVNLCGGADSIANISFVNGNIKNWTWSTWTWSPTSGITGTGSNLTINASGVPTGYTTYQIIGTTSPFASSCPETDTFYIVVNKTTSTTLRAGVITGGDTVCVGGNLTLSDTATSGSTTGTWSTSDTAIATISSSGVVTGVTSGTVTVIYALSSGCSAADTTKVITVMPLPVVKAITGNPNICIGTPDTLHDSTSGGTWSSNSTVIMTVTPTTGIVTGLNVGSNYIIYAYTNYCGSFDTTLLVNVSKLSAGKIIGVDSVCLQNITTLSDSVTGGTWISSNDTIATVSGGYVYGIQVGTVTITYRDSTACGIADTSVVVHILPYATIKGIQGSTTLCTGTTVTLTDSISGGTWSSGSPTVATVSSSGVVTGVNRSTVIITYGVTGICGTKDTTITLTVNNISAGTITGRDTVCTGSTTTLTDTADGGTGRWTSSNTGIATVAGGIVTGINPGTAVITYTDSNACGKKDTFVTVDVVLSPTMYAIAGSPSVCTGATTTLTDSASGGVWSSGTSTVATVSSSGVVTGINTGTTVITYAVNTSCGNKDTTLTVTVFKTANAGVITGSNILCQGSETTLTDTAAGGVWSSGSPTVATVSSAGVVTGVNPGTVVITYGVTTACGTKDATFTMTIDPLPGPIEGIRNVCVGGTITLTDTSAGGTWTTGTTSVATIGASTGILTGLAAGTTFTTYTLPTGCKIEILDSVVNGVKGITGPSTVCAGSTVTLADSTTGGSWASNNVAVATAGTSTGIISGITGGVVTISYSLGSGCSAIRIETVTPLPILSAISGSHSVCSGYTTTLTDTATGGSWSSSNLAAATINSVTGVVSGVTAGTATITFTKTNACGTKDTTFSITVTAAAALENITGTMTVCAGATTTLADASTGGTWSSSANSVATINGSGVVTGVGGGVTTIMYTLSGSCGTKDTTALVTVTPVPDLSAISGISSICVGTTTTLTDTASGGTWASSSVGVAGVGATSGIVTGVTTGSATITYSLDNACGAMDTTFAVTITPLPVHGTITGTPSVCVGATTTLADATGTGGGSWSTNATGIATVSPAGIVTGIAAGSVNISYTIVSSCATVDTFMTITVVANPNSGSITGPTTVCTGADITLTDAATGGVWSSGSTGTATVTGGVVTGISGGSATITYNVTNGCGTAISTYTLDVSSLASAGTITGASNVCVSGNITLSDLTTGGTWSATNGHAVVTSAGVVFGASAGVDTIKYSVTSSCGTASAIYTVAVTPATGVDAITGPSTVCASSTTTLIDSTAGGVWSSSNNTIATVSGGVVTGITTGTVTINYNLTSSCGISLASKTITVGAALNTGTISGSYSVCSGSFEDLTESLTDGTWSVSNSHATISVSGVISGVSPGLDTVYYTVTGACGSAYTMHIMSVTPVANTGTISGSATVCIGSSTPLTESATGGTWSSSNPAIATINSSGFVTGVAEGSVTIYYTVSGVCGTASANFVITVNGTPVAGTITGTTAICSGTIATLSDATGTPGGIWISGNTGIATVSATGVVDGIAVGSALITYQVNNGCGIVNATTTVNVSLMPTAGTISGSSNICLGTTGTLSDGVSGGNWTSSNSLIASVNSSGVVSGVANGSAIITYAVTTGCGSALTTYSVTISPAPNAGIVTGDATLCTGSSTPLNDTAHGGTWSTGNSAIATVNSSGLVTAVGVGTVNIYYTVEAACGYTDATISIAVSLAPDAGTITGGNAICASNTLTLTDAATGGVWSSNNATIATVGGSGMVTGLTGGSAIISYAVSTGCGSAVATNTVTVTAMPFAGSISGSGIVCTGSTTTLSDAATGGTWTSSDPSVATINASGVVSGSATGSTLISYTVVNSCGTATATLPVTVYLAPVINVISGGNYVCFDETLSLSDGTTGGIWSSNNTAVATVNSSGVVTGVSAGTAIISYAITTGCGIYAATETLTVGGLPDAGVITGTPAVCVGNTTTLTDTVSGGTWSSGNTAMATVNSTGSVTGTGTGVVNIYYTVTNSCGSTNATVSVAVGVAPSAGTITGSTTACIGSETTLSNTTATGTGSWSSSNPGIASVSSTGVVTGISAGITTITYTATNTCGSVYTTATINVVSGGITVNPITGPTVVCPGSITTFSDATPGGTWSSSDPTIATVTSAGVVDGLTLGSATLTYAVASGCASGSVVQTITVGGLPNAGIIAGTPSTCVGFFTPLTDTAVGGVWSSSNTSVATVSSSGVVSGVSTGIVNIYYTVTNSCGSTNATVSVNVTTGSTGTISPITGTSEVCSGSTGTLTDATSGGTWISGNTAIATISSTGVVTGLDTGVVTISYVAAGTCGDLVATKSLIVTTLPYEGVIIGATSLCPGSNTTLTESVSGGTWSSGTTTIATVNSTGVVSGISSGSDIITYLVTNACGAAIATADLTITALPDAGAITGNTAICLSGTAIYSDTAAGGTGVWLSSNNAIISINTSGIATGISLGTATLSYGVAGACGMNYATTTVNVITIPATAGTISGPATVCPGDSITLIDAIAGGSWSSSNSAIATVNADGSVTGISAGSATITYAVVNACGAAYATATVIVTSGASAGTITAPTTTLCVDGTISLSDATTGGTWSSSDPLIASVSSSGIVTGTSAGTATISYTLSGACGIVAATAPVTVNPLPIVSAITGSTNICLGGTTTLFDATSGGIWSSSNTAIESLTTGGIATGVSAGTAIVYYSVTNVFGCTAYAAVTDTISAPGTVATISGPDAVCVDGTISLSDGTAGGVWSSDNTAVATVDAFGNVTGISAGTCNIFYTLIGSGCGGAASAKITVNPLPVVGSITGASAICPGTTETLSDAITGGSWNSANASVAAIGLSSGILTGLASGTDTIVYTVTNSFGCSAAVWVDVTIDPSPAVASISGPTSLCIGASNDLTDATTGGIWSSSNVAIISITGSGEITGASTGTATLYYMVTNSYGCSNTVAQIDTVNTAPGAGTITGTAYLCTGANELLSDAITGGAWSSSNNLVATIGAGSGILTGVAGGTVTITYTVFNGSGCSSYVTATDSILAAPAVAAISGSTIVCPGSIILLTDATSGGSWSSNNNTVATISSIGVVTAVATGTDTMYYAVTNSLGCTGIADLILNVDTMPATAILPSGGASICNGSPVNLVVSGTVPGMLYQWYLNGHMITGASGDNYVADSAGVYTVDIAYGTCNVLLTSVTVLAQPDPIVGLDHGNILYTGSFTTYQWLLDGSPITGATSSTYEFSTTGNYQVVVTNMYGCTDTSTVYTILTLGVPIIGNTTMAVAVYPNPTTATINIDAAEPVNVTMTTVDGSLLIRKTGIRQIDMSELADGIYLMQVYDKDSVLLLTTKVVKMQ